MKQIEGSPDWLESRIILMTITGSKAYGTDLPESDTDYKGVCIPPEKYYFGLDNFREFNKQGSRNYKTKDDDISILHINKFVEECMAGTPNTLELLFTREKDIIKINKFGEELIAHRKDFLSKKIKHRFGGYAYSQKQKMINKKSNGTGRIDLIKKFNYDTKFFSHSVRLLTSAIEILKTGNFSTYRSNRQYLLDCRNGYFPFDEALRILDKLDQELEELYETSNVIPYSPDYHKINTWLIDLNKRAVIAENWNNI